MSESNENNDTEVQEAVSVEFPWQASADGPLQLRCRFFLLYEQDKSQLDHSPQADHAETPKKRQNENKEIYVNNPPEPVVFWMGSCVQGAVSMGSPWQAENVGLFMQWRSLVCGDEALHVDHSPQSDHSTGPTEHEGTAVLMASLLIVCFFPVFL